jgi:signal transduction histidine kinase
LLTLSTLGGRCWGVVGRVGDLSVSQTADLLPCGISRPADDIWAATVYLQVVHTLLARLRPLRLDPVTVDRLFAVALTILAQLEIWLGTSAWQHQFEAALITPPLTAAIAVRRRYPLLVGVAVPLVQAVEFAFWAGPNIISQAVANFCALYALTVWTPPRRFALGFALVMTAVVATAAGPKASLHQAIGFGVVEGAVMLLVRRVIGDRDRRARIAERERDVAAREAVVEERARIARELHDVIAHHVSMIVLQAGAERRVLSDANASTREVLETVEQSGRSALTEMRRLLGMLRGEANEPLAPQPGLGDVPTLVGQLRDAGLPIELSIDGERRELPVGIELSAYRIVQEALTNALKHAGDARATVHVGYGPDSLELEITDDGRGGSERASGGGHGLVGMRERVALYGGRFDARRGPAGGYAIRVVLPIR